MKWFGLVWSNHFVIYWLLATVGPFLFFLSSFFSEKGEKRSGGRFV
jgi:hypothetical protein